LSGVDLQAEKRSRKNKRMKNFVRKMKNPVLVCLYAKASKTGFFTSTKKEKREKQHLTQPNTFTRDIHIG
jgi:hypothetical protein